MDAKLRDDKRVLEQPHDFKELLLPRTPRRRNSTTHRTYFNCHGNGLTLTDRESATEITGLLKISKNNQTTEKHIPVPVRQEEDREGCRLLKEMLLELQHGRYKPNFQPSTSNGLSELHAVFNLCHEFD